MIQVMMKYCNNPNLRIKRPDQMPHSAAYDWGLLCATHPAFFIHINR